MIEKAKQEEKGCINCTHSELDCQKHLMTVSPAACCADYAARIVWVQEANWIFKTPIKGYGITTGKYTKSEAEEEEYLQPIEDSWSRRREGNLIGQ